MNAGRRKSSDLFTPTVRPRCSQAEPRPPPVLEALEYLWSSGWKGRYLPEDAPLAAVGKGWERLLSGGNVDGEPGGKIARKA